MTALAPSVIRDALKGDRPALRSFVDAMSPIIQARVVRGLARRRAAAGNRDPRQEVEDMTQDVFAALFAHDGRVLRSWDPERGLSLANFVGLVADRHVASMLRSGKRSPWTDTPVSLDEVETAAGSVPGAMPQIESRRALSLLLDRLRESLSPRGLELFQRLYVDEEPVDDVGRAMGMTREAIYAWRNRVGKILGRLAAEIEGEPAGGASDPERSSRSPEREPRDG